MSIAYYDKNAEDFLKRTINVAMSSMYEKFLKHISSESEILDAGCGTGRDAKHFKSLGYEVTAFDPSVEMVRISTEVIGQPTLQMRFQDVGYDFESKFDGIWANASLLHVPYREMKEVLALLYLSLKPGGILYASFKYGIGERVVGDRMFYDMTETTMAPYLDDIWDILAIWQSEDTRRKEGNAAPETWLNIICQKENLENFCHPD
jgi:SAM-dependent methyltransferase